jgi:hypothetical protein
MIVLYLIRHTWTGNRLQTNWIRMRAGEMYIVSTPGYRSE